MAWAVGKPVVLISGFTEEYNEFYTPHRIINKNVCHGCWNDTNEKFDKNNWMWCPRNKDFECSKKITSDVVIAEIDRVIKKDAPILKPLTWDTRTSESVKDLLTFEFLSGKPELVYERFFKVEKDDIVVDLGAHIGLFCRSIEKREPKKIIAVEPSAARYDAW